MTDDLLGLAHALSREGEPFALATVVRCERPTSAKPGARALIRPDGTVLGWIGGGCAEPVVVKEALTALRDGQPRLVALVGEGGTHLGRREGVLEYPMTCHSGGTIEVYIEPVLPTLELLIVGRGPVVETLGHLGEAMNFTVTHVPSEAGAERISRLRATRRTFIVVATYGTADEDALEQALRSDAGYVSLVTSRKRAQAVGETLRARGVSAERLGRLRAPAGLDIGAVSPQEIAVSILAEIIQVSRREKRETESAHDAPADLGQAEARDPVCGMSVQVASAAHRSEIVGRRFYFCCAHCKQVFDQDPARYVGSAAG